MSKILEFQLGGSAQQRLRLRVTGRERPDMNEVDDENWLTASAEVRAGAFAGAAEFSLRTEDLAEFRKGLAELTDGASSPAHLKTMENQLALRVDSKGGALLVGGHVGDRVNQLTFGFTSDGGTIPTLLQSLDAILDAYPSN